MQTKRRTTHLSSDI